VERASRLARLECLERSEVGGVLDVVECLGLGVGRERIAGLGHVLLVVRARVGLEGADGDLVALGLDASERLEAHGGARDADELAEPRGEPVVDQHAKRLAHARHVAQLRRELVDGQHARMRVEEGGQHGPLGGVGIGHPPKRYTNICSSGSLGARPADREIPGVGQNRTAGPP
jgi:hypothetical protein